MSNPFLILAGEQPKQLIYRAHVMDEESFLTYAHGGKKALEVKQSIRDMYKSQGYAGIDVYSPNEELLFRVTYD